jgi:hypothetical protein
MNPLPAAFLGALRGHDELIVTTREGGEARSVRSWFVVAPPGVIYLFTSAFSLRVHRWRTDPWVQLRIPDSEITTQSTVHVVDAADVDAVAPLVTVRWADWGATHVEGLRRMIRDGTHVLVRVEGPTPH